MAEKLLTLDQTAARLGLSRWTFYRHKPRLVARGLQEVRIGKIPKYREASLDTVIKRAAETGRAI